MSLIKASAFIAACRKREGEGYVYGATGQICTIALLKAKERQYGKRMGNGYYHLNGDYTKGKCARWLGKRVQDCSNFLQDVRRELGQKVASASADMLFDSCVRRGEISTMPHIPGVLLFKDYQDDNREDHVGIYTGKHEVTESAGATVGVIHGPLKGWTQWGIANFLEYDLPTEDAVVVFKPVYYTVVRGDTLSKIGKKFNVPWRSIANLNGIKFPWSIRTGKTIRIK